MKLLFSLLFLTIVFFSCTKSGSPVVTPPPVQDSLLKSYTIYYPLTHTKSVQVFRYDSAKQLAGIYTYKYDSASGTPGVDSIFLVFSLTNLAVAPANYDYTSFKDDYTAHHFLYYDDQMRMIRDSMATTSGPYLFNLHARYDAYSNTIIDWLTKSSGGYGEYSMDQTDTLNIQVENIFSEVIYDHGSFYWTRNFTRGIHISPLYNEKLAKSLGCMIYVSGLGDYRSKNLPTHMTDTIIGYGSRNLRYNWTSDAAGRVSQGTAKDVDDRLAEISSFIYND